MSAVSPRMWLMLTENTILAHIKMLISYFREGKWHAHGIKNKHIIQAASVYFLIPSIPDDIIVVNRNLHSH